MKLNKKRTILIGFAFLSISVFWQFYNNEIPKILKNTFDMGETMIGVVMALDNVLALFLLPWFGRLSDKTNTKMGKRMPYIVFGTIASVVLMLTMIGLFNHPEGLTGFVVTLLLLLVAMGIYRSPAVALMPDLTPAPLRSSANAIINLMGAVGGMLALIMIRFLIKDVPGQLTNYMPLTIGVCACMVVSIVILYFTIDENKIRQEVIEEMYAHGEIDEEEEEKELKQKDERKLPSDVKRSMGYLLASVFLWFTAYNAVITAWSRYAEHVLNLHDGKYASCLMVATGAAVISFIPIGYISKKLGRKKTVLMGVSIMTLCYLVACFVTEYTSAMNIMFALIGFGWASINVNSYPMVVEMGGHGDIGKYTGIYYTFSMAAQIFTPIFSGYLLEHVSYQTLFPYAVVFSILSFITMTKVKHGDVQEDHA